MAEKGGFKHFMLKEIFEQPRAVRDTSLGRISLDTGKVFLDQMEISEAEFRNLTKVQAGGVRHQLARRAGRQIHDRAAGADSGRGRLRQRISLPRPHHGRERADDCHYPVRAKPPTPSRPSARPRPKGSKTLAICNVVGAMIAREADGTIYTHAGPEIGVASTKAFTSQLAALFIFAVYLGQLRGTLSLEQSKVLAGRIGENTGQT